MERGAAYSLGRDDALMMRSSLSVHWGVVPNGLSAQLIALSSACAKNEHLKLHPLHPA